MKIAHEDAFTLSGADCQYNLKCLSLPLSHTFTFTLSYTHTYNYTQVDAMNILIHDIA